MDPTEARGSHLHGRPHPPVAADPLDPLATATEAGDVVPTGLPVWRRVSPHLIWIMMIRAASWVVIICLGAGAVWYASGRDPVLLVAAVAVVAGLIRAALAVRSVRAWGYAERDDDLLVRHGLLVRRLSIVPYARMQFVDVTAGPLERAFGIATVSLHTAAAASDAQVPGLPAAEAARLRDRLTALGKARTEGL